MFSTLSEWLFPDTLYPSVPSLCYLFQVILKPLLFPFKDSLLRLSNIKETRWSVLTSSFLIKNRLLHILSNSDYTDNSQTTCFSLQLLFLKYFIWKAERIRQTQRQRLGDTERNRMWRSGWPWIHWFTQIQQLGWAGLAPDARIRFWSSS